MNHFDKLIISRLCRQFSFTATLYLRYQGRREGSSSVAFEVLIMNCELDSINLFIFNCLTSTFCFPKNMYFASRRERLFIDARP